VDLMPAARAESGKSPRARLEPEARRDQILDAAARTVLSDGVTAVGLEQLARDVGISKALAYTYFRNRYDLLAAMAGRRKRLALACG
jgi:AcrR family transcriptional regulator